jgi:hypothetical protein
METQSVETANRGVADNLASRFQVWYVHTDILPYQPIGDSMKSARIFLAALVLVSLVAAGYAAYSTDAPAECPSCEACP